MVPSEVDGEEGTVSQFFRFPRTPHLAWLGNVSPRDDKLLSPDEAQDVLAHEVVVEEKLDGANVGISVGPDEKLRAQNRGQYVTSPSAGQFEGLSRWMGLHESPLFDALGADLILFGEWCAARHSLRYDNLPDWFVVFDVYDRPNGRFWSTDRRDALACGMGLSVVPAIFHGNTSLQMLKDLVQSAPSQFRHGPLEGIIIRRESPDWLITRAKLVRTDFVQQIGEHWRRRVIEWNQLRTPSPQRQSLEGRN
jgi:ATP-dependent RNA circularization protein (DNA/RNA ligase family)